MDGREEGRRKQSLAAGLGGAGGAAPEISSAHARPGTSEMGHLMDFQVETVSLELRGGLRAGDSWESWGRAMQSPRPVCAHPGVCEGGEKPAPTSELLPCCLGAFDISSIPTLMLAGQSPSPSPSCSHCGLTHLPIDTVLSMSTICRKT